MAAYSLFPNLVGDENGLPGNTENVQRYAELIDKKYLWMADFGDKDFWLIPKWYASNRYWASFESKAGDAINFTYKHSLLSASYPFSLTAKNDAGLYSSNISSLLKKLKMTPQDIAKLLNSIGKYDHANVSWSTIPVSNLAQGGLIGNLTVEVASTLRQSAEATQKLIVVMLDGKYIHSSIGDKIKVEMQDCRIENEILIVVFEKCRL